VGARQAQRRWRPARQRRHGHQPVR